MDLSRLYQLTTDELRGTANRLGVTDAQGLSRAQLISAIRQRAPQPTSSKPRGIFGRVVGIAKMALQSIPLDPGPPTPPTSRKKTWSSAPPPKTTDTEPSDTPPPAADLSTSPSESADPPVGTFSPTISRPSRPAALPNEPIITKTMARILADQGHFKRSLAMYGTLMREKPFDESLQAEATKVRAQSRQKPSFVTS